MKIDEGLEDAGRVTIKRRSRELCHDVFPRLSTGMFLLSVLESRCATRHCVRDMICRHISMSALTSSSFLAVSSACVRVVCVSVFWASSHLKGKSSLNQSDSTLLNMRRAGLICA